VLADDLAELIFVNSPAVIIVLQLPEQFSNLVLYFMVQIPNLSATLCSLKNVSTAEEMQVKNDVHSNPDGAHSNIFG